MNIEIIQQSYDKMQEIDAKMLKGLINGKDFSDETEEYSKKVCKISCDRIGKYLELIDEAISNSAERQKNYNIDGSVVRSITIPLGEIRFKRTRYINKTTGEYVFLLDNYLEIEKNERMTDSVKARILEEAIDTTYKKGGEKAGYNVIYSKQTTKNIIDKIDADLIKKKYPKQKKEIEYLYIDADEAHVKIQKNKDVKQVMCKEIYVYEGKELESPKSKRKRLVNKWTFSGIYEENAKNIVFWNEVREYIENTYQVSKIKMIYLNGDGGGWIKEGMNMFQNMKYIFDKFHLMQYINRMTNHLKDSAEEAKREIYSSLAHKDIYSLNICIDKLYKTTEDPIKQKNIATSETFIKNNIEAIHARLNYHGEPILGCSAEAHISHDLASRMTTICRGWSVSNADKMSKLRAFKLNGGNIYELIKTNHESLKSKNNDIVIIKPSKDKTKYICTKDKVSTSVIGKYFDVFQATIDNEIRRKYRLYY